MNIGIADTSGQLDHRHAAELLAPLDGKSSVFHHHWHNMARQDSGVLATRNRPYVVPSLGSPDCT